MAGPLQKRYGITLSFVRKYYNREDPILDLGVNNELADYLREDGFRIQNTEGQDLDIDYRFIRDHKYITAFEIFEHMFAPFNLLNEASGKLIASVPLRLWFAPAFWDYNDRLNCHYHEFEIKQFDHLMERTGWKIMDSLTWKSWDNTIGIRPLLRRIYPRYYIVYAEK
ncbi:MAG: methyltransferase [Bacteroidales bacterium]|jgi:hypothetical protein|nr:methyltransferase [Bacteroidales bacterium]